MRLSQQADPKEAKSCGAAGASGVHEGYEHSAMSDSRSVTTSVMVGRSPGS